MNIVRIAKEFSVTYNGEVISRCTDFNLSIGREIVDITSLDSDAMEHICNTRDWSISFGSMVAKGGGFVDIFDLWASDISDYPVHVSIGDYYEKLYGRGTIELEIEGAVGDTVIYSGAITGSGKLTKCDDCIYLVDDFGKYITDETGKIIILN